MKLEKEVEILNIIPYLNKTEFYCCINEDILEELVKYKNQKVKLTLEIEEPILDDAERKYLSGVIRPFKNEVECIRKVSNDYYKAEHIVIYFKDRMNMPFPYFKKNTMYKNLELNKEYTLEELGL